MNDISLSAAAWQTAAQAHAALAAALCARYGLHEQRASKHARALRLK